MSSDGPGSVGTDGSDYIHRETVSQKHHSSIENKYKIKRCMVLHYGLFMAMTVKILLNIVKRLNIVKSSYFFFVPDNTYWEFIWLFSLSFSYLGFVAINKNKISFLKLYIVEIIIFGLGPLIYTCSINFNEVVLHIKAEYGRGLLLKDVAWVLFVVGATQVHACTLYFSWKLLETWTSKKEKQSKED